MIPDQTPLKITLPRENDTKALAIKLASLLTYPFEIHFQGEIGSGKTCFIRHLLQYLGVKGAIKSPTYALMEQYGVSIGEILHVDLYRISEHYELEEIGFYEAKEHASLVLIEWPEKISTLSSPDLLIRLRAFDESHEACLQCYSDKAKKILHCMDG